MSLNQCGDIAVALNLLYIHVHVDDRYVCSDVYVLSIVHVGDDVSAHNRFIYVLCNVYLTRMMNGQEGMLSGGRVC